MSEKHIDEKDFHNLFKKQFKIMREKPFEPKVLFPDEVVEKFLKDLSENYISIMEKITVDCILAIYFQLYDDYDDYLDAMENIMRLTYTTLINHIEDPIRTYVLRKEIFNYIKEKGIKNHENKNHTFTRR